MRTAKNKCCDCGHKWQDWSGVNAEIRVCPKCSSLYWYWLDYEPSIWARVCEYFKANTEILVPFGVAAILAAWVLGVYLLAYCAQSLLDLIFWLIYG